MGRSMVPRDISPASSVDAEESRKDSSRSNRSAGRSPGGSLRVVRDAFHRPRDQLERLESRPVVERGVARTHPNGCGPGRHAPSSNQGMRRRPSCPSRDGETAGPFGVGSAVVDRNGPCFVGDLEGRRAGCRDRRFLVAGIHDPPADVHPCGQSRRRGRAPARRRVRGRGSFPHIEPGPGRRPRASPPPRRSRRGPRHRGTLVTGRRSPRSRRAGPGPDAGSSPRSTRTETQPDERVRVALVTAGGLAPVDDDDLDVGLAHEAVGAGETVAPGPTTRQPVRMIHADGRMHLPSTTRAAPCHRRPAESLPEQPKTASSTGRHRWTYRDRPSDSTDRCLPGEQIWHRCPGRQAESAGAGTATTAARSSSHEHPNRRHCFRRGPHGHRRRHWRSRSAYREAAE